MYSYLATPSCAIGGEFCSLYLLMPFGGLF
jgi:hypothetical protein